MEDGMRRLFLAALVVAGCVAVAAAASAPLPDIPHSYIFSPAGKLVRLRAGVTYQASSFPLPLRVTPSDGSWTGAQWKANLFPDEIQQRHLSCSSSPAVCAPPYYGWVAIGKGGASPSPAPRALILIMGGFSRTPSVAATVQNLRTRGHGATYDDPSPVKLAGFPGVELDGQTVGPRHVFIPFSPPTSKATGHADAIEVDGAGHPFRFAVLNVRGKTVVVFLGTLVLSPDEFTAFLPQADRFLGSLQFPNGG